MLFRPLVGDEPVPVLIDARQLKAMDRDAQKYYSGDSVRIFSRIAIVADGVVSTMIANLFLTVFKPRTPTRLFGNEAEALAWFKSP